MFTDINRGKRRNYNPNLASERTCNGKKGTFQSETY